jgi:lambda family phage portal protein
MGLKEAYRAFMKPSGGAPTPKSAFFQGGRHGNGGGALLNSWRPQLREAQADIALSWHEAAARSVDGIHNSGFLTKILETETGSVVGTGLRWLSRPDPISLNWTPEDASKWARMVEKRFRAWGQNPAECDASGKMTFDKMQQAAFASYKCFGEILAMQPLIRRPGSLRLGRVLMLPPTRLSHLSNGTNIVQGVKVDDWGFPQEYTIRKFSALLGWQEQQFAANDRDGRPQVLHIFDSALATTRGISPMANILKVVRQVDQYADATLTSALIQTIFAAVIKTNITGQGAFDGLMTKQDGKGTGMFDLEDFAEAQRQWYDGSSIDLTQHGRIAQLFPNDELTFTEAKQPGQQYDAFMGWLMREVAAGCGVTYESATGDYRGATYSSIRMAGAEAWLTVLRRRANLIIPFCEAVKSTWLDEEIQTGRIPFPGGYFAYIANRDAANMGSWSGPSQPQADDFKAARSHEVLHKIQGTTLSEISAAYGRDWDEDMRQRAEENRLADELEMPRPWIQAIVPQPETADKVAELDKELAAKPDAPVPGKKVGAPASSASADADAELEEET